jgi:putative photosynthetic complex assembly protein
MTASRNVIPLRSNGGASSTTSGATAGTAPSFGTNGFVRGVLRGLARERRLNDVGAQPPFQLTRWSDGRLSLDDPATGRRIDLVAFGPTNAGAFAQLLTAPDPTR